MSAPQLHIAVIPDGNRRWAKQQGLLPWQGHEKAFDSVRALLEWCQDSGLIAVFTLWCFSTDNWNRSSAEVKKLMVLIEKYLQQERSRFQRDEVRLVHSGRADRIPVSLAKLITDISTETAHFKKLTFHIALDYGGRDELLRAIQKLPDVGSVNAEELRAKFDQPSLPDIDLIIRTSGEQRTSNFFLWQAAYAEWLFVNKYFPDFTPEDLATAVQDFMNRERRFGK